MISSSTSDHTGARRAGRAPGGDPPTALPPRAAPRARGARRPATARRSAARPPAGPSSVQCSGRLTAGRPVTLPKAVKETLATTVEDRLIGRGVLRPRGSRPATRRKDRGGGREQHVEVAAPARDLAAAQQLERARGEHVVVGADLARRSLRWCADVRLDGRPVDARRSRRVPPCVRAMNGRRSSPRRSSAPRPPRRCGRAPRAGRRPRARPRCTPRRWGCRAGACAIRPMRRRPRRRARLLGERVAAGRARCTRPAGPGPRSRRARSPSRRRSARRRPRRPRPASSAPGAARGRGSA